jgi:hypothetical protein
MHSSLSVTTEGLAAVKPLRPKNRPNANSYENEEGIRWLENLKQSTEFLDNPGRCLHLGDRERDIYELFCAAQEVGPFLVRLGLVSTVWLIFNSCGIGMGCKLLILQEPRAGFRKNVVPRHSAL